SLTDSPLSRPSYFLNLASRHHTRLRQRSAETRRGPGGVHRSLDQRNPHELGSPETCSSRSPLARAPTSPLVVDDPKLDVPQTLASTRNQEVGCSEARLWPSELRRGEPRCRTPVERTRAEAVLENAALPRRLEVKAFTELSAILTGIRDAQYRTAT